MSYIGDLIKAHFDAEDIRYDYFEEEEECGEGLEVTYKCDNKDSVTVNIFLDDDGNSLSVKSYTIAKVPDAKLMDTYVLLNELNSKYRWAKFFLDNDNEISVSGDAIINEANVGEECLELVYRFVQIIDEVYPRIMKVIWA